MKLDFYYEAEGLAQAQFKKNTPFIDVVILTIIKKILRIRCRNSYAVSLYKKLSPRL